MVLHGKDFLHGCAKSDRPLLIPFARNKDIFDQRENCRQIYDRKAYSINSIQCALRSSIFGVLVRSNMPLFLANGMRSLALLTAVKEPSPEKDKRDTEPLTHRQIAGHADKPALLFLEVLNKKAEGEDEE